MRGSAICPAVLVGELTARYAVGSFGRRTLALLSYLPAAFCTFGICLVAYLDPHLSVDRCGGRNRSFNCAVLSQQIAHTRAYMVGDRFGTQFDLVSALFWCVRMVFGAPFDPRHDLFCLFDDSCLCSNELAVGFHNGVLFGLAFYMFFSPGHGDFV